MSNEISKQEYLKRYLENKKDSERKRKKKAKARSHISRLKIIDQDIGLKSMPFGDEMGNECEDDEAPVIAEVIDDRPVEVKIKELYASSCWKKIDSNENPQPDVSATGKISAGDIEYADLSTPKLAQSSSKDISSEKNRHDSDSDLSPPRHKERTRRKRHDSDANQSEAKQSTRQKIHDFDSDKSPPTKSKQNIHERRNNSDSDLSPPRETFKNKHKKEYSDSDISPPRVSKQNVSRKRHSSSDISPPRHKKDNSSRKTNSVMDICPKQQNKIHKKRYDSDSDISPPRQQPEKPSGKNKESNKTERSEKSRNDFDSDMSPSHYKYSRTSMEDENKPRKTLSGLKAGLQDSETLRKETQDLRKREKIQINMLDDEMSGRNAKTVIRDRKTGLRRDLDQERQVKDEENKKAEEHQKKYTQWGKGIEQTQNKMDKFQEDVYEMSKPLARYRDDEDLDNRLKNIVHNEDPMADYIKRKKQKDMPTVPVYSGPPAPPNRFGIPPGYRWDGVDRSNGFEHKYLEKINASKAIKEEAYLWSVQNM